ncbi:hypothetical protein GE061_018283, partial [Apolygus lucorum]
MEKFHFIFQLLGKNSPLENHLKKDSPHDFENDGNSDSTSDVEVPSLREVQKELEFGLNKQSIRVQTQIVDVDPILRDKTSSLLR